MSRKSTSKKTAKVLRPMTNCAIERAALADPDAHPLTHADRKRMKPTPQANYSPRSV